MRNLTRFRTDSKFGEYLRNG